MRQVFVNSLDFLIYLVHPFAIELGNLAEITGRIFNMGEFEFIFFQLLF